MTYVASKNYDYDAIRASTKALIDIGAEARRQDFVVVYDASITTIDERYEEALRGVKAQSSGTPRDPEDYPMLTEEIGVVYGTLDEVINAAYGETASLWQVLKEIEAVRLQAKLDVDAAPNEKSTIEALADIDWILIS